MDNTCGKTKVVYFLEGNNGPVWWMTLALQAKMKSNRQLGTAKSRAKTKIELLLTTKGITTNLAMILPNSNTSKMIVWLFVGSGTFL
jgi:hypothetical protein